jgi:hypothetical protein
VPTFKLVGETGAIAMEDNVAFGVDVADFDEQDAVTMIKANINPMARQYPMNRSNFLFIVIFPPSNICSGNACSLLLYDKCVEFVMLKLQGIEFEHLWKIKLNIYWVIFTRFLDLR